MWAAARKSKESRSLTPPTDHPLKIELDVYGTWTRSGTRHTAAYGMLAHGPWATQVQDKVRRVGRGHASQALQ